VKTVLNVLIIWVTLLAMPLQGIASATTSRCGPPAATAQHAHDCESVAARFGASDLHAQSACAESGEHTGRRQAAHHHAGKCAACGSCVSMAPPFIVALPGSVTSSITVSVDQRLLPSVDLALPERPPRA